MIDPALEQILNDVFNVLEGLHVRISALEETINPSPPTTGLVLPK